MTLTHSIKFAFVAALFAFSVASTSHAMDVETYLKTAKKTMKAVKKNKVRNVDDLIEQQRELIRLGVEGCLEFAEKSPADAKMMHLIVLNSLKMQNLSLAEIEAEWHAGGYLRAHGIDVDKFTQADVQINYYDAIVHPATAIIALNEYKKSPDSALLEQIHDELAEVVHHVEGLK